MSNEQKLQVEITDGKFKFSYEIYGSKHSYQSPLSETQLIAFVDLLKQCHNVAINKQNEFINEINAQAWIRDNPEKVKECFREV